MTSHCPRSHHRGKKARCLLGGVLHDTKARVKPGPTCGAQAARKPTKMKKWQLQRWPSASRRMKKSLPKSAPKRSRRKRGPVQQTVRDAEPTAATPRRPLTGRVPELCGWALWPRSVSGSCPPLGGNSRFMPISSTPCVSDSKKSSEGSSCARLCLAAASNCCHQSLKGSTKGPFHMGSRCPDGAYGL